MKRDRRGRYTSRSRWEVLIGWSMVAGIVLPLIGHAYYLEASKPVTYESNVEEVKYFTCPYDSCVEVRVEWTEERIVEEIKKTFPEEPELAVAIARCESNFKPSAVGPTSDYGIFQIHAPSWDSKARQLGLENYRTDVQENLAMARHIYLNANKTWRDWVCLNLI